MIQINLFGLPNVDKLRAKKNTNGLTKALEYRNDASIRSSAAEALGIIGDSQTVKPLIEALKDNHHEVRKAVAIALGKIGNEEAVRPLVAALKNENMDVSKVAIKEALKSIGKPALEIIISNINRDFSSHYDSFWREADAMALEAIADQHTIDLIIAFLDHEHEYKRLAAAKALGVVGDPQAIEPLISALKNRKISIRKAAASALVSIYRSGKIDDPSKKRILQQRSLIKKKHEDGPYGKHRDNSRYKDAGTSACGQGHEDQRLHVDKGIGLKFPL